LTSIKAGFAGMGGNAPPKTEEVRHASGNRDHRQRCRRHLRDFRSGPRLGRPSDDAL